MRDSPVFGITRTAWRRLHRRAAVQSQASLRPGGSPRADERARLPRGMDDSFGEPLRGGGGHDVLPPADGVPVILAQPLQRGMEGSAVCAQRDIHHGR